MVGGRLFIGFVLGAVLLGTNDPARAQSAVERPSGVDAGMHPGCIEIIWTAPPDARLKPECIHQRSSETGSQQRARGFERYWRIGLAAASQVMATAQWAVDIFTTWDGAFNLLKSSATGYEHDDEVRTVYLLERASARLERRANQIDVMLTQHQVPGLDERFEIINMAVTDALKRAELLEDNAAATSERALAMAQRLGDVEVGNSFLDGTVSLPSVNSLPSIGVAGEDHEVRAIYDRIFALAPSTVSGRPLRSSAGPAGSPSDSELRCPVESFDNEDPEVVFARAQVMAMGGQMSTTGTQIEAQASLEKLEAIREAEEARERMLVVEAAVRAFSVF